MDAALSVEDGRTSAEEISELTFALIRSINQETDLTAKLSGKLEESADPAAIRARYKELVKRLHPDANGGDRSREEKLREIIQAYKHLRTARLA